MKKKLRKDDIRKKLSEIEDSISIIKENLPSKIGNFLSLGLIKDGIYKKIEFAIENVIDICSILNRDLSLGVPSDEEDIIQNLAVKRVLSSGLIEKIEGMKGFRNIVVHKYGRIDDEFAFEILHNNLSDFNDFIKEIRKVLDKF